MKIVSRKFFLLAVILAPLTAVIYLAVSVLFVPQLLFFPFHRVVGGVTLYSETPISDAAMGTVQTSGALLHASPLSRRGETFPPIFLTDGGWRWSLLSMGAGGAFALTRPSTENIIVNRSDLESDRVWNGSAPVRERSLSAVIAHERTHTLIRRHFGRLADSTYPMWVREGYCDFVARSSTLSDEQAAELRASNSRLPALSYYDARRRVAAVLGSNGGSVQNLFNGSHDPR